MRGKVARSGEFWQAGVDEDHAACCRGSGLAGPTRGAGGLRPTAEPVPGRAVGDERASVSLDSDTLTVRWQRGEEAAAS